MRAGDPAAGGGLPQDGTEAPLSAAAARGAGAASRGGGAGGAEAPNDTAAALAVRAFRNDLEGAFVSRPNRFIVIADTEEGRIRAHCPNPGRLTELLIPGRRLIFERRAGGAGAGAAAGGCGADESAAGAPDTDGTGKTPEEAPGRSPRRTRYTLVGGYYHGQALSLYSARANQIARELVLPTIFPGARDVRAEPRHEGGRFDFAVETPSGRHLVEVKACTLIHNGVGMFPDAVSARASRHLQELAEVGGNGHIVFVIMRPAAERFVPDLHTDPVFAQTLREISGRVHLHAVSVACTPDGCVMVADPSIPVDLSPVRLVDADAGAYMLVIHRSAATRREVGSLGELELPAGYYVYVGSGRRNLAARVKRHLRRRKRIHWHVDHLTVDAEKVTAYPIYTDGDIECDLAARIRKVAGAEDGIVVPGFGSSDCGCPGHLVHLPRDPLRTESFVEALLDYRMNAMT